MVDDFKMDEWDFGILWENGEWTCFDIVCSQYVFQVKKMYHVFEKGIQTYEWQKNMEKDSKSSGIWIKLKY